MDPFTASAVLRMYQAGVSGPFMISLKPLPDKIVAAMNQTDFGSINRCIKYSQADNDKNRQMGIPHLPSVFLFYEQHFLNCAEFTGLNLIEINAG